MTAFDYEDAQAAAEVRRLAGVGDKTPEASFAIRVHANELAEFPAEAMARLAGAAAAAGVLARTEQDSHDYVMVGLGPVPETLRAALPAGARIDTYT